MKAGYLGLILTGCVFAPTAAVAQAAVQAVAPESWRFAVTAYGYLPQISGTAEFTVVDTGTSFTLGQQALLDHLKMTFMGAFDAHRGPWGLFTDVLYLDLGNRKTNFHSFTLGDVGIPASTSSDVSLDMKSWIVSAVGEYRVVDQGGSTLDVTAGLRYLNLKERLEWSFTGSLGSLPPGVRAGNSEISNNHVDGIVGVKGQLRGDGGWTMPFYLDIGGGSSDFTWQGATGLAYVFHWGELGLLFRYLDYRFSASSKLQDLSVGGPMVGATFRW